MYIFKPLLWSGANVMLESLPVPLVVANNEWYDTLIKPDWAPREEFFPVIWTFLNIFIGISSYWACQHDIDASVAFIFNRFLSLTWTPTFFELKNLLTANKILRLIIASALFMLFTFEPITSKLLLIPYIVWLIIAERLNRDIIKLNPVRKKTRLEVIRDDVEKFIKNINFIKFIRKNKIVL